jgi:hypothetical protein
MLHGDVPPAFDKVVGNYNKAAPRIIAGAKKKLDEQPRQ